VSCSGFYPGELFGIQRGGVVRDSARMSCSGFYPGPSLSGENSPRPKGQGILRRLWRGANLRCWTTSCGISWALCDGTVPARLYGSIDGPLPCFRLLAQLRDADFWSFLPQSFLDDVHRRDAVDRRGVGRRAGAEDRFFA